LSLVDQIYPMRDCGELWSATRWEKTKEKENPKVWR